MGICNGSNCLSCPHSRPSLSALVYCESGLCEDIMADMSRTVFFFYLEWNCGKTGRRFCCLPLLHLIIVISFLVIRIRKIDMFPLSLLNLILLLDICLTFVEVSICFCFLWCLKRLCFDVYGTYLFLNTLSRQWWKWKQWTTQGRSFKEDMWTGSI